MERSVTALSLINIILYTRNNLKSTIACALEQHLLHLKKFVYRLDGDNIRFGLNKDLGFDEKSRNENIRRIGEVREQIFEAWIHYFIPKDRLPNSSPILVVYALLPSSHLIAQIVT